MRIVLAVNTILHIRNLQNASKFCFSASGANLTSGVQVPSGNAYPGSCDTAKPYPFNTESKCESNQYESTWYDSVEKGEVHE